MSITSAPRFDESLASVARGLHLTELTFAAFAVAAGRDGIEHACSSSVTFVVIVFAVSSVVQALVMLAALRSHERALEWQSA